MGEWERLYRERKFYVNTAEPSKIVSKGLELLQPPMDFRALDLGCGNGRNTVYTARSGGLVEAIDLADINFKDGLPREIQDRITFRKMSVMDMVIQPGTYSCIIATRLLQYLDKPEVHSLFSRIEKGLTHNGLAMLSYTASGGVFDNPNIDVPKYKHTVGEIRNTLEEHGLELVLLEDGLNISTHVIYQLPNETYDILVRKKQVR